MVAGGPASSGSIIKQITGPPDPKKVEENMVGQIRKTLAARSGKKTNSNPMGNNTFYQGSDQPTESTADLDFARVTYFDRSAAFGFSVEDKLGRLAEINKH